MLAPGFMGGAPSLPTSAPTNAGRRQRGALVAMPKVRARRAPVGLELEGQAGYRLRISRLGGPPMTYLYKMRLAMVLVGIVPQRDLQ